MRLLVLGGRAITVLASVLVAFAACGHLNSLAGFAAAAGVSGIWFLCLEAGLATYPSALRPLGPGPAVVQGTLLGALVVSAVALWLRKDLSLLPVLASTAAIIVLATAWETIAWRRLVPKRRIVVVGTDPGALELMAQAPPVYAPRFDLLGFVDEDPSTLKPPEVRLLGGIDHLAEIISIARPDLVVLALRHDRPVAFEQLLRSANVGFQVVEDAQFSEHAFGRVPMRDLSHAWFMGVLHLYRRQYSQAVKRTFDVIVSTVGFVLMAPAFALVALLVRTTPGPIVLRQTRVGENGKLFTIYKFRTMRDGAEEHGRAVWASNRDSRATGVGALFRSTRLDELPQLWNVLRGDMSIVGPRPERPEFHDDLERELPFWSRRSLVKPGITGWAQVRRGYAADVSSSSDKLAFDLWYLRHRSLLVDLAICAKTVVVVLRGDRQGAAAAKASAPSSSETSDESLDNALLDTVRR